MQAVFQSVYGSHKHKFVQNNFKECKTNTLLSVYLKVNKHIGDQDYAKILDKEKHKFERLGIKKSEIGFEGKENLSVG